MVRNALLLLAATAPLGCGDAVQVVEPHAPVTRIAVSPAQLALATHQTSQLMAVGLTATGDTGNITVTWSATGGSLADTVSTGPYHFATYQPGTLPGSYLIIATGSPGGMADTSTVTVTVTGAAVATVTVSPAVASLLVGATLQLTATPQDSSGRALTGRVVTWSSSDTARATVNSAGLVAGRAAGSATITARSEGKTGAAAITVRAPGSRVGYYVAPNGSPSGDGSAARPWNLATALAGPAAVNPGDTIWLRGGTYAGAFTSRLSGAASDPVVVRQYPGERATIDGTLAVFSGSHVWFWGFEVTRSVRSSSNLGINVQTPGIRLINLVVHDATMSGIYLQASGSLDSEIYGCICYNNGDNTNLDHGIYAHTMGASTGALLIEDNITFNNLAYGLHQYATGGAGQTLRNITQRGNVAFNNNTISAVGWGTDLLHGGSGTPVVNGVVRDNFIFRNLTEPIDYAMRIGYSGVTGTSVSVMNNYGASTSPVQIHPFTTLVNTGNAIYQWAVGSPPTTNRVVVRPNKYEAGRAHIIVYNWALQSSVSVDVSEILKVGDRYAVQNVQDFYGTPVANGTYAGGALQLPMTAIPAPTPIGRGVHGPPTGPTFNVFVLTKTP